MSNAIIQQVYEDRLATWAAARMSPLTIAFKNTDFNPPEEDPYLEIYHLPAETNSIDLAGVLEAYRGVVQINVVNPNKDGQQLVNAIVAELKALLPNNLRIQKSGFVVQQISVLSDLQGSTIDNRYTVPCRLRYYGSAA